MIKLRPVACGFRWHGLDIDDERSTYRSDSARGRDGAHGPRGLAEGVAEHIKEVYEVLWYKRKPIAKELQLMERRLGGGRWF
jgi:hypothetical protein